MAKLNSCSSPHYSWDKAFDDDDTFSFNVFIYLLKRQHAHEAHHLHFASPVASHLNVSNIELGSNPAHESKS